MKYVALLRGINVGGNNIIKMIKLKASFEKMGFANVVTYIQSGNVVFDSKDSDANKIEQKIETALSKTFKYTSTVMVRSLPQMKKTVSSAPKSWFKRKDIRCYVGFLKGSYTSKAAAKELQPKPGVDEVHTGPGAVYMTTVVKLAAKSSFNKLVGTKLYKAMTIRNLNTVQKLLALMGDA